MKWSATLERGNDTWEGVHVSRRQNTLPTSWQTSAGRGYWNREPYPGWPATCAGAFERLHLIFQELDVMDGFIEHGSGVHLGPAGDESLENPDLLADPFSPVTRRHALGIRRYLHVAPLRRLDRLRVDMNRLHGGYPEYHLPHCRHRGGPLLRRITAPPGKFAP
nr:hypothetical protein MIMGU_mgv1a016630mg [Ipomoea batatas]